MLSKVDTIVDSYENCRADHTVGVQALERLAQLPICSNRVPLNRCKEHSWKSKHELANKPKDTSLKTAACASCGDICL